jgi:hypothetical protein
MEPDPKPVEPMEPKPAPIEAEPFKLAFVGLPRVGEPERFSGEAGALAALPILAPIDYTAR